MISFTKMQGIGNDFVMVDALSFSGLGDDLESLAREVCDRRFGVGADGLIVIGRTQPPSGDASRLQMRMWNPDGSVSEMCGNGLRCAAKLIWDRQHAPVGPTMIETGAGLLLARPSEHGVSISMGRARLRRDAIGIVGAPADNYVGQPLRGVTGNDWVGTAVSMGNPHLVIPVESTAELDLAYWGPILEHHPDFLHRTNVHFVQVVTERQLAMRTWERGAGITLACGTGACAVAAACAQLNLTSESVEVSLPGGGLSIDLTQTFEPDSPYEVQMTGPAETVFHGEWIGLSPS